MAYRLAPARYAPALFSSGSAFLKVWELPQVVDLVECSYLREPCCDDVSVQFSNQFRILSTYLQHPP